jgi:hypothetical protein
MTTRGPAGPDSAPAEGWAGSEPAPPPVPACAPPPEDGSAPPDWLAPWELVRADKAGVVFFHLLTLRGKSA